MFCKPCNQAGKVNSANGKEFYVCTSCKQELFAEAPKTYPSSAGPNPYCGRILGEPAPVTDVNGNAPPSPQEQLAAGFNNANPQGSFKWPRLMKRSDPKDDSEEDDGKVSIADVERWFGMSIDDMAQALDQEDA